MDDAACETKTKMIQYVNTLLKTMLGTSGLEKRKVNRWWFGFTLSAILCAAFGSPLSFAATQNVSVGSNFFSPSTVTINVNDGIKWTWAASNHTSTSDTNGI